MKNVFPSLVLFLLLTTASFAGEQRPISEAVSPKLRSLLDAQPVLLRELNVALNEITDGHDIRVFYFYGRLDEIRSFHMYPDPSTVFIYLPEGLVALDQYLLLLYESYNATHETEFVQVMNRGENGKLDRSQFARELLKIEFGTVRQVQKNCEVLP